jgi:hypothetical protein
MTVRVRPLARRDLKRHFRYIHQFNPAAAWAFRAAALTTIKQIARYPGLGHQMGFAASPACAAWSSRTSQTTWFSGGHMLITSMSSASCMECKTFHASSALGTEPDAWNR